MLGVACDETAAAPGDHERGIKFENVWNENRAASGDDIMDEKGEVEACRSGYSQLSGESDLATIIFSEVPKHLRVASSLTFVVVLERNIGTRDFVEVAVLHGDGETGWGMKDGVVPPRLDGGVIKDVAG